jgi:predicted RNA binding protein YcfA (HicA-like mRNA interferase family)
MKKINKPLNEVSPHDFKTTKSFVDFVEELGYCKAGQNGSHMKYKKEGSSSLSIVAEREIAPGTCRNLLKLILGEKK